jgi:hypothetical protein
VYANPNRPVTGKGGSLTSGLAMLEADVTVDADSLRGRSDSKSRALDPADEDTRSEGSANGIMPYLQFFEDVSQYDAL